MYSDINEMLYLPCCPYRVAPSLVIEQIPLPFQLYILGSKYVLRPCNLDSQTC